MTEKPFPALEVILDKHNYVSDEFKSLYAQARAELEAARGVIAAYCDPLPSCTHDMVGDEDICDGCHFIWEKRLSAAIAACQPKE